VADYVQLKLFKDTVCINYTVITSLVHMYYSVHCIKPSPRHLISTKSDPGFESRFLD